MKKAVHFFGGQANGWALDEDLARAREAVGDRVKATSFAAAEIIHSAWWPPLVRLGQGPFRGKKLVCFADNPPALYLTQPGFESAAEMVDLWIARSSEATAQFQELGLPVKTAPYTANDRIFFPLDDPARRQIRSRLGLDDGDFVVGNFHRDSLARDVSRPKAQKGPDILLDVFRTARREIPNLKVLLAGPRRHWLRQALEREDIPCVFHGSKLAGDDFDVNTLAREELNRLYAALDAVVISSRWEGGPYAVLEALLARRPVISTKVGMAADLLPGWIYADFDGAAGLLRKIAEGRADFSERFEAAQTNYAPEVLGKCLVEAYETVSSRPPSPGEMALAEARRWVARLGFVGEKPVCESVAKIMQNVRDGRSDGRAVTDKALEIAAAEKALA